MNQARAVTFDNHTLMKIRMSARNSSTHMRNNLGIAIDQRDLFQSAQAFGCVPIGSSETFIRWCQREFPFSLLNIKAGVGEDRTNLASERFINHPTEVIKMEVRQHNM